VDLWDWLGALLDWLLDFSQSLRLWLIALLAALVIWWLYVPYFPV
jgi:hypothetical protein